MTTVNGNKTHRRPLLDHLVPREECALFAPFDELPAEHVEPVRPLEGIRIEGYTHEQFMRDHNHEGWLAWQLSRPLTQPKHSAQPIDLTRGPSSPKQRAAKTTKRYTNKKEDRS